MGIASFTHPAAKGRGGASNPILYLRNTSPFARAPHESQPPQGGRGRDVAGHSFQTGAPVPQPSTTHAPAPVAWQPTPQPSAALAVPTANRSITGTVQANRKRGRCLVMRSLLRADETSLVCIQIWLSGPAAWISVRSRRTM